MKTVVRMRAALIVPQFKEATEIEFWRRSPDESQSSDSLTNILNKAAEAQIFTAKLEKYGRLFAGAQNILEVGGGQCWASCIVKRLFTKSNVTATDISPAAVASVPKWEHIFEVKIDRTKSCRSYATPFPDQSFDLVFAYAAAHHFVRHRSTIRELFRILRPGGAALYLHEPGCQSFMHGVAYRRANAKRPDVPEDVLVYRKIELLGREAGFDVDVVFAPTLTNRGPSQAVYFSVINKLPLLQHILPTTVDILLRKPG